MKASDYIIPVFVAGFFSAAILFGIYPDQLHKVRSLAVENHCGGYDHDTGEFRWEKSARAEELMSDLPDFHDTKQKTVNPHPGIRIK